MRVQLLVEETFQVVGTLSGNVCETIAFINNGEASTAASRAGLALMLEHVAKNGLQGLPAAWAHLVDQEEKIYEFSKGDLRLFFFKGHGNQIAVCTSGVMKKKQKVDKAAVAKAIASRNAYFAAVLTNSVEVISS